MQVSTLCRRCGGTLAPARDGDGEVCADCRRQAEGAPATVPPGVTRDERDAAAPAGLLTEEGLRACFPRLTDARLLKQTPSYSHFGARDAESNLWVEVHALNPEFACTTGFRDTLLQHARQCVTLDHPAIVPVLHAGEHGGVYFVINAYFDGRSLDEFIHSGAMKGEDYRRVVPVVCEALAHAHNRGVLHLAVHSRNVLVSPAGEVRLAGFALGSLMDFLPAPAGLSAEEAADRRQRDSFRPPEYHPGKESALDFRSDVFSVGVLLYQILTGKLPSSGFFSPPSSKARVEEGMDDVVMLAMHPEPAKRFAAAGPLKDAVMNSTSFRQTYVPQEPARQEETPAWKPEDHRTDVRWKWVAVLVALLIAAAGAYFLLGHRFTADGGGSGTEMSAALAAQFDEAEKLIETGQLQAALAMISQILDQNPGQPALLERALELLEIAGEEERALELAKRYLEKAGPGHPNRAALQRMVAGFESRVTGFREAMREAKEAARRGDYEKERLALLAALDQMPLSPKAAAALAVNPSVVEEDIQCALTALRDANPAQKDWRTFVHPGPGRVVLDLADNPELRDIHPLRGLPLTDLDLSRTGVADLSPLADSALRRLRIDETWVTSLAPIESTGIELLSFEGARVRNVGSLKAMRKLHTVRYRLAGHPRFEIAPPRPRKPWENHLGMRFEPLPGAGHILVSAWETRVRDFAPFVRETGRDMLDGVVSLRRGAWDERGHSWDRPGFETGDRFPAVGVSHQDAVAFCEWLTTSGRKHGYLTGDERYRLPTDLEWSLAAGLIEHPHLPPVMRALQGGKAHLWGREWPPPAHSGNFPGRLLRESGDQETGIMNEYIDGFAHAAPAGRFAPFRLLHDLGGNAREWCADKPSAHHGAEEFLVRGAGWAFGPDQPTHRRDAFNLLTREALPANHRATNIGFRPVLELGSPAKYTPCAKLIAGNWAGAEQIDEAGAPPPANPWYALSLEHLLALNDLRKQAPDDRVFPDEVLEFKGHRYFLSQVPLDWENARRISEEAGGHLAAIGDAAEQTWLRENFLYPNHAAGSFWVGGYWERGMDGWGWLDPDRPDAAPAAGGGRRLQLLRRQYEPLDAPAKLEGFDPRLKAFFLIEWESPSPTTPSQASERPPD